MKKFKGLFLTLFLLVITFVPSVVFAEVKEVKNESEFIKAIADGNDIKIVEDFTVNGRHDVKKDLTIDLNNHEISFSYKSRLEIKGAKVVIDGTGKMKEIDPNTAPIAIVGSQNKEDELYSTLTVKENVTLEGFYGTFITVNTDSKKVSYDYGIKVDIYGTLIGKKDDTERGAAFYVNGQNKIKENCPIVTIHSSAKLLGDGEGIYLAGYADVTIEKDAIITGGTGIEARAGKLTVNGAIITGTDEELVSKANSNGATTYGAGIAMVQHVSKVDVNILINDATVKANTALFVEDVEKNGSESLRGSSLFIRDGVYSGKIKINKSYLVEMTRGRFDEDVTALIPSTYDVVRNDETHTFDIIGIYTIDDDKLLESVKYYSNGKEIISAAEGEEIKVVATPKKGYYIKSITRTTRTDEVLVKNGEFTMPYEATEVLFDIVKIEDEKDNLILIPTPIAVDDKIDKDIVEDLSERKLDNSKSGLLDAVDKSKLTITDNGKIALSIETSLKSYDKNSKTLVYDIKPYYIIDGGEKKEIPNEAIKKSVSIKVPILKEITEKYAKVIHKNGDKVIDEKTYEIKTDGNEKYIIIETSSFSTFEISFTNNDGDKSVIIPDNTGNNNTENKTTENKPETKDDKTKVDENVTETPSTSDNVLLYVFASVISVAGVVVLTCISKKKKILR